MSSSEAVRCSGLVRRFGERDALAGLDLVVADGEVVLLTGPNGAGKTTLLRVLATVLRPSAGSASLYGHALPGQAAPARRLVGYAGHEPLLYPLLTAAENLRLYSALHGSDGAEVESALEGVGMARRAGDRVEELSRGMRQRLSLARAMLHGPRLLLLDEPTSGLDPLVRCEFIQTVSGAYQEADPGRRTVFISTHLISEFEGLIDEFTIIENGKEVLTLEADCARERFQRIRARFAQPLLQVDFKDAHNARWEGRELELVVNGNSEGILDRIKSYSPEALSTEALTLEDIFLASLK